MSEIVYKKLAGLFVFQKEKDEIKGKIVHIIPELGEYNSKGYVIETETEIRTVPGSTVLDQKIETAGIQIGDYIKIVYLGTKEGEKKNIKTMMYSKEQKIKIKLRRMIYGYCLKED